ncbi:MAG: ribonuclease P protein component [Rhodospirillales bacterium]|nr:ribonuclease P protein component [Rhodospirillales bacterium]MCB9997277.1 ribonuclease P protein component [Rhodospirillales bacterium]
MQASKEQIKTVGRLKKRSDFLRVQRENRKWVSKSMIVQIAPAPGAQSRYGITVTKRLSKSAVVRNRIKRRLRAAACEVLPGFKIDPADIILIGRPDTETLPYDTLKNDLAWCLRKLRDRKDEVPG